ncbi:MAG: hypothetical protein ACKOA8_17010 [Deltaproteobacteria bacterium]
MNWNFHKRAESLRLKRGIVALIIGLLSIALISSCGSKTGPQGNPTSNLPKPTAEVSIPSAPFMEEALPGTSLLNGTLARDAFRMMATHLKGKATFTVVEERAFDYMVSPSPQNRSFTLTRQEGKLRTPEPNTYSAVAINHGALGGVSLSLMANPNSTDYTRTFVFQYQIDLFGISLKSTDKVALFKATQSRPFATDFLRVDYTNRNPSIQRFRVSSMSPFPISGTAPQLQNNFWGTQWLNVVSQKITTVFQYPK